MSSQKLRDLFRQLNSKNIVYNKAYYKLTGSVPGAVLLSHLSYLYSERFAGKEFYQSDAQLMESLGFSLKTLRTSKESIRKYATATKKGVPAKNHWIVHEDAIIDELISLDLGISSCAEIGMTGGAENGSTGEAENGTCKKQELLRNKELKSNSSSAVDKALSKAASACGISQFLLSTQLDIYGADKVRATLEDMASRKGIHSPDAWFKVALTENYQAKPKATSNVVSIGTPSSYEVWSPELQAKRNRESEALCDPNDVRDIMLKEQMDLLRRKVNEKESQSQT